jgi:hypothetical protein
MKQPLTNNVLHVLRLLLGEIAEDQRRDEAEMVADLVSYHGHLYQVQVKITRTTASCSGCKAGEWMRLQSPSGGGLRRLMRRLLPMTRLSAPPYGDT